MLTEDAHEEEEVKKATERSPDTVRSPDGTVGSPDGTVRSPDSTVIKKAPPPSVPLRTYQRAKAKAKAERAALVKAALASLNLLRSHLAMTMTGLGAREPPPRKEAFEKRREHFERGRLRRSHRWGFVSAQGDQDSIEVHLYEERKPMKIASFSPERTPRMPRLERACDVAARPQTEMDARRQSASPMRMPALSPRPSPNASPRPPARLQPILLASP